MVWILWSMPGWLMLGLGRLSRRSWRKKAERERARAMGTIVENVPREELRKDRKTTAWYPVVRFDVDGRELRQKCEYAAGQGVHPVGQVLEVLYDPDDPSHFHFDADPADQMGLPAIRIGVIWIVVATVATLILYALSSGYGLEDIPYVLKNLPVIRTLFR